MNDVIIETHDFEVAKNGLKRFLQKSESDLELDSVSESGGFFGLGDHKVTGAELNKRLSIIQTHLIDMNKININTVKEFGQVYDAFEALDRDYIPVILMSIKAAEKANVEVKEAQADIGKILDNQKKTLEILKGFQKKIESYKHISDIDKLWGDFLVARQNLAKVDELIQSTKDKANKNTQDINTLNNFKNRIEKIKHIYNVDELWNSSINIREKMSLSETQMQDLLSRVDIQSNSIDVLNDFKNAIDLVAHLKDVDSIWEDVKRVHDIIASMDSDIKSIQKDFDNHKSTYKTLLDYKTKLEGYEHLDDIDRMWVNIETNSEKISENDNRIMECNNAIDSYKQSIDTLFIFKSKIEEYEHLCDVDSMWHRENELQENLDTTNNLVDIQQKQIIDIEKAINEIQQNNEIRNKLFSRKLKIAYAIAGSSIGIAMIELILIMIKVI